MRSLVPLLLLALPGVAAAESYVPDQIAVDVDVLVVLDSSPAAADGRAAFAEHVPGLIRDLEARFPSDDGSTRISLHVGFVTGDDADGARLRVERASCFTTDPPFPWVIAERDRWSELTANFVGETADAVACALPVTLAGAEVQHLGQAAATALDGSVPVNEGFRRDGALLAVLFVPACAAPVEPVIDGVVGTACDLAGFVDAIAVAAEPEDDGYHPGACDGGVWSDDGGAPAEATGSDGGCSTGGGGGLGALVLLSLAAATARSGSRRDP